MDYFIANFIQFKKRSLQLFFYCIFLLFYFFFLVNNAVAIVALLDYSSHVFHASCGGKEEGGGEILFGK